MAVHQFESSGEAYDATQCDESIKNGDVLVIASEGVIGIADTWPVAVTIAKGELHEPAEGSRWRVASKVGKHGSASKPPRRLPPITDSMAQPAEGP
jgi:hypothetical protein